MIWPSPVTSVLLLYNALTVRIKAASLIITTIPSPPLLGNAGFKVRATYNLQSRESFRSLHFLKSQKDYAQVFGYMAMDTGNLKLPLKNGPPDRLVRRAEGYMSEPSKYIELRLRDTKCEDANCVYKFAFSYQRANGDIIDTFKSATFDITAHPKPPDSIRVMPERTDPNICVKDMTTIKFTCVANVGRPLQAGHILWYAVMDDDTVKNLTSRATETTEALTPSDSSCTYRKSSMLELVFDRKFLPGKTSVRCAVNHPDNNYHLCSVPSAHYCLKAPTVCIQDIVVRDDDYGEDNVGGDTSAKPGPGGDGDSVTSGTDGGGDIVMRDDDDGEDNVGGDSSAKPGPGGDVDSVMTGANRGVESVGVSTTAVVLSLLGGVVVVIFIGVAVFFFCPRRSKPNPKRRHSSRASQGEGTPSDGVTLTVNPAANQANAPVTYPRQMYIAPEVSTYVMTSSNVDVDDDTSSYYSDQQSSGYGRQY